MIRTVCAATLALVAAAPFAAAQQAGLGPGGTTPEGTAAPGAAAAETPGEAAAGVQRRDGYELLPSVTLRETLTNNANGQSGSRSGDLISTVQPSLSFSAESPRVKSRAEYSFSYDKYAHNDELDGARHNLLGFGTYELWREHAFIETQSSISQEIINRSGQITATDRNLGSNNNQTTVQTFRVGPVLKNNFGNFVQTELRYALGVTSAGGGLDDATRHEFNASATSGDRFARAQWGVDASHLITERSTSTTTTTFGSDTGSTTQSTVDLKLQYAVDREWSALGSVGYQTIKDSSFTNPPDGPTGSLGFEYAFGPRAKLRILGNHRNDDNYMSVAGNYEFRSGSVLTVNYDESITSGQDQLLNNVAGLSANQSGSFVDSRTQSAFDPRGSALGVGNFSNSAIRRKTGTIAYVGNADERTVINVRARYELSSSENANAQSERSQGLLLNVTRALGPFLNFVAGIDYSHANLSGTSDDTYLGSVGFSYTLTPTVTVGVDGRWLLRAANQEGSGTRETAAIFQVRKTF
jgi:uncharacterized protein (PEP-CTERM system associated)